MPTKTIFLPDGLRTPEGHDNIVFSQEATDDGIKNHLSDMFGRDIFAPSKSVQEKEKEVEDRDGFMGKVQAIAAAPGAFFRGVKSGTVGVAAANARLLQIAPIEWGDDYLESFIKRAEEYQQANANTGEGGGSIFQEWEDTGVVGAVQSAFDIRRLAHGAGSFVPQIISILTAGGVGGATVRLANHFGSKFIVKRGIKHAAQRGVMGKLAQGLDGDILLKKAVLRGQQVGAVLQGGLQEGASTYDEVIQKGGTEAEAIAAMGAMTAVVGFLNTAGAAPILGKLTPSFARLPLSTQSRGMAAFQAGGIEMLTEFLEEPAEEAILHTMGFDPDYMQAVRDGLEVAAQALVIGGTMGAAGFRNKDLLEKEEEKQAGVNGQPGNIIGTEALLLPKPYSFEVDSNNPQGERNIDGSVTSSLMMVDKKTGEILDEEEMSEAFEEDPELATLYLRKALALKELTDTASEFGLVTLTDREYRIFAEMQGLDPNRPDDVFKALRETEEFLQGGLEEGEIVSIDDIVSALAKGNLTKEAGITLGKDGRAALVELTRQLTGDPESKSYLPALRLVAKGYREQQNRDNRPLPDRLMLTELEFEELQQGMTNHSVLADYAAKHLIEQMVTFAAHAHNQQNPDNQFTPREFYDRTLEILYGAFDATNNLGRAQLWRYEEGEREAFVEQLTTAMSLPEEAGGLPEYAKVAIQQDIDRTELSETINPILSQEEYAKIKIYEDNLKRLMTQNGWTKEEAIEETTPLQDMDLDNLTFQQEDYFNESKKDGTLFAAYEAYLEGAENAQQVIRATITEEKYFEYARLIWQANWYENHKEAYSELSETVLNERLTAINDQIHINGGQSKEALIVERIVTLDALREKQGLIPLFDYGVTHTLVQAEDALHEFDSTTRAYNTLKQAMSSRMESTPTAHLEKLMEIRMLEFQDSVYTQFGISTAHELEYTFARAELQKRGVTVPALPKNWKLRDLTPSKARALVGTLPKKASGVEAISNLIAQDKEHLPQTMPELKALSPYNEGVLTTYIRQDILIPQENFHNDAFHGDENSVERLKRKEREKREALAGTHVWYLDSDPVIVGADGTLVDERRASAGNRRDDVARTREDSIVIPEGQEETGNSAALWSREDWLGRTTSRMVLSLNEARTVDILLHELTHYLAFQLTNMPDNPTKLAIEKTIARGKKIENWEQPGDVQRNVGYFAYLDTNHEILATIMQQMLIGGNTPSNLSPAGELAWAALIEETKQVVDVLDTNANLALPPEVQSALDMVFSDVSTPMETITTANAVINSEEHAAQMMMGIPDKDVGTPMNRLGITVSDAPHPHVSKVKEALYLKLANEYDKFKGSNDPVSRAKATIAGIKLSEMVEELAMLSGYTGPLYHWTRAKTWPRIFNGPRTNEGSLHELGEGFYASTDPIKWQGYVDDLESDGKRRPSKDIIDTIVLEDGDIELYAPNLFHYIKELRADIGSGITGGLYDPEGKLGWALDAVKEAKAAALHLLLPGLAERKTLHFKLENPFIADGYSNKGYPPTHDQINEAKKKGHDGVIFQDQYVIFDATKMKSSDPVTYTEKGEIIPLSQRFDKDKLDVNYVKRPFKEHIKSNQEIMSGIRAVNPELYKLMAKNTDPLGDGTNMNMDYITETMTHERQQEMYDTLEAQMEAGSFKKGKNKGKTKSSTFAAWMDKMEENPHMSWVDLIQLAVIKDMHMQKRIHLPNQTAHDELTQRLNLLHTTNSRMAGQNLQIMKHFFSQNAFDGLKALIDSPSTTAFDRNRFANWILSNPRPSTAQIDQFTKEMGISVLERIFMNLFYGSMLSGVSTMTTNVFGNLIFQAYQVPHRWVHGSVDAMIQTLFDSVGKERVRKVYASESMVLLKGMMTTVKRNKMIKLVERLADGSVDPEAVGKQVPLSKLVQTIMLSERDWMTEVDTRYDEEIGIYMTNPFPTMLSDLQKAGKLPPSWKGDMAKYENTFAWKNASKLLASPGRALRSMDIYFKAIAEESQQEAIRHRYERLLEDNNIVTFLDELGGLVDEQLDPENSRATTRSRNVLAKEWAIFRAKMAEAEKDILNTDPDALEVFLTAYSKVAAQTYAEHVTFQDRPGSITKRLVQMRNDNPWMRIFAPFLSTVSNITKRGIEMTPASA